MTEHERERDNSAVKNEVIVRGVLATDLPKRNKCKECCSKCNKDVCWCFHCCVKSWSCCLNGAQGVCNISAAGCMMCSTCCTGCSKCIEEVDCDGK